MFYEFEVQHSSQAWQNPSVWANTYKINVTANTPAPEILADYLLQSHAATHRQHVKIERCVFWKTVDRIPGDGEPEPVIPPFERDATLVILPHPDYDTGAQPGNGAGAHELALRVSRDVPVGRRGMQFYRGMLELSDVHGYPEPEAALLDVNHFRTLFTDGFWLHFLPGPGVFFVERGGNSAVKFGQFTRVREFTVRGVSLPRGIDRAFGRVKPFRKAARSTIMTTIDVIANIRKEFAVALALNEDYTPFAFVSKAQQALTVGYGTAVTAMQAVSTDEDQVIQQQPAYIARGGASGDAILGTGAIYATGAPNDLHPSEGYIQMMQAIGQIQPDVVVPSGEYLSHSALDELWQLIAPFVHAAFYMARGVYLHPGPKEHL